MLLSNLGVIQVTHNMPTSYSTVPQFVATLHSSSTHFYLLIRKRRKHNCIVGMKKGSVGVKEGTENDQCSE